MTNTDEKYAPDRHIPVSYDRYGNPKWHTVTSPPDSSVGICMMVSLRVIPVIFVPGVMGSNLKGIKNKNINWRMDTKTSLLPWLQRGPEFRKQYLTPNAMTVDDDGLLPTTTQQHPEELKRRGWGEVGAYSYGEWLAWLENQLNDVDRACSGLRHQMIGVSMAAAKGEEALTRDEVALSYRYRFPVWACGYNWLDDNKASAGLLEKRIQYALDRYRGEGKTCDKVILVTHSMGGLVARYASEVTGLRHRAWRHARHRRGRYLSAHQVRYGKAGRSRKPEGMGERRRHQWNTGGQRRCKHCGDVGRSRPFAAAAHTGVRQRLVEDSTG